MSDNVVAVILTAGGGGILPPILANHAAGPPSRLRGAMTRREGGKLLSLAGWEACLHISKHARVGLSVRNPMRRSYVARLKAKAGIELQGRRRRIQHSGIERFLPREQSG